MKQRLGWLRLLACGFAGGVIVGLIGWGIGALIGRAVEQVAEGGG